MPSLLNQKMPFHYPLILNTKEERKKNIRFNKTWMDQLLLNKNCYLYYQKTTFCCFFSMGLLWISKAFSFGQAHHTSCRRMLTDFQQKNNLLYNK
jgi:hypothetical protein